MLAWLAGAIAYAQAGTGPLIEQRLANLRGNAAISPIAEIPTDKSLIPPDWLGLLSWNIQVGGVTTDPSSQRPSMVEDALKRAFQGTYSLLAAQEISGSANSQVLLDLLPDELGNWTASFVDTTDTQDNGFWFRSPASVADERTLFTTSLTDASGRLVSDPVRAVHPPRAAHFKVGDFDFTHITVHLTFADGNTGESVREMKVLLDYLDEYFATPGHDPDVIISGDFNIPSRLSGQTGSGGVVLDQVFEEDQRFQIGERRFVTLVHEPTSRKSLANGGSPASNYDHFVVSADSLEELVLARRVSTDVLTEDPDDPEQRLTSDHFPIVAFFRTRGADIGLDGEPRLMSLSAVVNGASFGSGIASGSWISIFGSDLAPTTRLWKGDEIIDGVLPTQLDGVRVRINGKQAAISFISPGQLNVQAPDDDALGPVSVEVIRDGVGSATGFADLRGSSPAFFLFDPENRRYLAAVHPDGVHVGKANLFGGAVPTRRAKPGDIILLFGTGFGPTTPPVPAGQLFTGAAPLASPVRVFFGGVEAQVQFGGLSGAGLNQLNVVVPQGLPSGDVEVVAQTSGLQTQAGVFVTIEGAAPPPPPGQGVVVISQVYGGGGNQGATLTNDFVELFNRGSASINIAGWSIQYASATGSSWASTPLSGSLLPGQYFLVKEGMGASGGNVGLPTPDATGGISLSATSGKVALVKNTSLLNGTTPAGPSIADFVGYGSAGFAEGSPGPELSNTTALRRAGSGCVDTNNNASDFTETGPSPRNSATTPNPCP